LRLIDSLLVSCVSLCRNETFVADVIGDFSLNIHLRIPDKFLILGKLLTLGCALKLYHNEKLVELPKGRYKGKLIKKQSVTSDSVSSVTSDSVSSVTSDSVSSVTSDSVSSVTSDSVLFTQDRTEVYLPVNLYNIMDKVLGVQFPFKNNLLLFNNISVSKLN